MTNRSPALTKNVKREEENQLPPPKKNDWLLMSPKKDSSQWINPARPQEINDRVKIDAKTFLQYYVNLKRNNLLDSTPPLFKLKHLNGSPENDNQKSHVKPHFPRTPHYFNRLENKFSNEKRLPRNLVEINTEETLFGNAGFSSKFQDPASALWGGENQKSILDETDPRKRWTGKSNVQQQSVWRRKNNLNEEHQMRHHVNKDVENHRGIFTQGNIFKKEENPSNVYGTNFEGLEPSGFRGGKLERKVFIDNLGTFKEYASKNHSQAQFNAEMFKDSKPTSSTKPNQSIKMKDEEAQIFNRLLMKLSANEDLKNISAEELLKKLEISLSMRSDETRIKFGQTSNFPTNQAPNFSAVPGSEVSTVHGPEVQTGCGPGVPTVKGPEFPVGPSPEFPVGPGPEFPVVQRTEFPVGPGPEFPLGQGPEFPLGPGPEFPVGPGPEIPVGLGPEFPVVPGPEFPVGPGPQFPVVPGPQFPVGPGPDFPVVQGPDFSVVQGSDFLAGRTPDLVLGVSPGYLDTRRNHFPVDHTLRTIQTENQGYQDSESRKVKLVQCEQQQPIFGNEIRVSRKVTYPLDEESSFFPPDPRKEPVRYDVSVNRCDVQPGRAVEQPLSGTFLTPFEERSLLNDTASLSYFSKILSKLSVEQRKEFLYLIASQANTTESETVNFRGQRITNPDSRNSGQHLRFSDSNAENLASQERNMLLTRVLHASQRYDERNLEQGDPYPNKHGQSACTSFSESVKNVTRRAYDDDDLINRMGFDKEAFKNEYNLRNMSFQGIRDSHHQQGASDSIGSSSFPKVSYEPSDPEDYLVTTHMARDENYQITSEDIIKLIYANRMPLNIPVWEIRNSDGLVKGPFSSLQMRTFYQNGQIQSNLLVRYSTLLPFLKFSELFPELPDSQREPFIYFPLVTIDGRVYAPLRRQELSNNPSHEASASQNSCYSGSNVLSYEPTHMTSAERAAKYTEELKEILGLGKRKKDVKTGDRFPKSSVTKNQDVPCRFPPLLKHQNENEIKESNGITVSVACKEGILSETDLFNLELLDPLPTEKAKNKQICPSGSPPEVSSCKSHMDASEDSNFIMVTHKRNTMKDRVRTNEAKLPETTGKMGRINSEAAKGSLIVSETFVEKQFAENQSREAAQQKKKQVAPVPLGDFSSSLPTHLKRCQASREKCKDYAQKSLTKGKNDNKYAKEQVYEEVSSPSFKEDLSGPRDDVRQKGQSGENPAAPVKKGWKTCKWADPVIRSSNLDENEFPESFKIHNPKDRKPTEKSTSSSKNSFTEHDSSKSSSKAPGESASNNQPKKRKVWKSVWTAEPSNMRNKKDETKANNVSGFDTDPTIEAAFSKRLGRSNDSDYRGNKGKTTSEGKEKESSKNGGMVPNKRSYGAQPSSSKQRVELPGRVNDTTLSPNYLKSSKRMNRDEDTVSDNGVEKAKRVSFDKENIILGEEKFNSSASKDTNMKGRNPCKLNNSKSSKQKHKGKGPDPSTS